MNMPSFPNDLLSAWSTYDTPHVIWKRRKYVELFQFWVNFCEQILKKNLYCHVKGKSGSTCGLYDVDWFVIVIIKFYIKH